ncbi:HpcH/HpaI aldolase family protein [Falsiroseomonas selenitidurans]|uniref:Aldolase n=1 Tax=Falsiroseomonas selenitidurans TaxID=2716335 RepID=A0ABX1DX70_9PROT|nr:aldolase/citrate lyase family protein [Falsiroseomonas selenitidurans]NKC29507.1 aldolase [Falsiroseomonas selenitidurans]
MEASGIAANGARRILADGGLVLCMGLRQARTVDIGQMVAACGFESLYIDMEHSPVGLETVSAICTAAAAFGVTPLVRPPGHGADWIGRILDGGAQGIVVPHVNTAAQARAIVDAARFPPTGHRSVMGPGPAVGYRALPLGQINATLNAATLVVCMIETPEGVANADAIAAVEGVDVLLIGSNDLCTEMGIPGELRNPRLREAYVTVAEACRAQGKVLGVGGIRGDAELQKDLIGLGARFLIAGNDVGYLMAAARADAALLHKLLP